MLNANLSLIAIARLYTKYIKKTFLVGYFSIKFAILLYEVFFLTLQRVYIYVQLFLQILNIDAHI